MLHVKHLVMAFGGVIANDHVSLELAEGVIAGLIGPNGAGKTTLFNCIAGYYTPNSGRILFEGRDTTGWPPDRIARIGIARTFQGMHMMPNLTVEENVMVGAFCRTSDPRVAKRQAAEVLELLDLTAEAKASPRELAIAVQKRIELARSLATQPKLLMLDEIAAGLNPVEIKEILQTLRRIKEEKNLTLFLTEHVMEFIMAISEVVAVMAAGKKIAEGPPEEVVRNEEVIEAYLGERYAKGK